MKRYHVVIKTSTGCELLSRDGYGSGGVARRAWSTATRGAVLLEDGMVVEAKGGTVLAVENELRRSAARLMRELALTSAPDDEEEVDEERDEEEADDEDDEPAPRPYKEPPVVVEPVVAAPSKRSTPVRASKPAPVAAPVVETQAPTPKGCEHCGVAAPDHRYDCPTIEIQFDAPQTAQEAQEAAPVEPVKAAPVAVVEAPSVASEGCVAKGCKLAIGETRTNTPVEFHCLCPGHRVSARGIMRGRGVDRAAAVAVLRAEERTPYPTGSTPAAPAKKASKKVPAKKPRLTKRVENTINADALLRLCGEILVERAELSLVISSSAVRVVTDSQREVISARREGGADPLRALAGALVPRAPQLITLRTATVVSYTESLAEARTRLAEAESHVAALKLFAGGAHA